MKKGFTLLLSLLMALVAISFGNFATLEFSVFSNAIDTVIVGGIQNSITLPEDLPADTYALRYEDANGVMADYADICSLEITDSGENAVYDGFIAENCAPKGATIIGVYNSSNERVGDVALGSLNFSYSDEKQYSFGAISDTHIGARTAAEDMHNALEYFENDSEIDFTTICGDLTLSGSENNLNQYKSMVDAYEKKPIYAISGNHEANAPFAPLAMESLKPYTGQDLYYSFTKGDDVYIMVGIHDVSAGYEFAEGELQWLYETLEANRNKRCFLFMHLYPRDGSGDAVDLDLAGDMLNNTQGKVFYSLLSHYRNIIYFHGHSHEKFEIQEVNGKNNYDNLFGCHSIHIPSLAYPKYISGSALVADYDASEGYVVDVYENNIVLRGRDFITGKFLPIASYFLDTTINNVTENTYYDPTGTIVNSNSNVLKNGSNWYDGSVDKSTITKISLVDNYSETNCDESWDAGISNTAQITVYRTGTELTIEGNEHGIIANKDSKGMFSGFTNLTQIDGLETLDTSNITELSQIFKNCCHLTSLNLSGFNDANPTSMNEVFYGCSSLKSIDVSQFDLEDVNKYNNLFANCCSLENVKWGNTVSTQILTIYCVGMFANCCSLTEIDMTAFSGKSLDLASTFRECTSLKNIIFGQTKLIRFKSTFVNCSDLERIDMSNFEVSNIGEDAFKGCSSLTSVIIPYCVTSIGASAFSGCSQLKSATILNSETAFGSNVFYSCHSTFFINGFENSTAKTYALENGHLFSMLNALSIDTLPVKTSYFVGDELSTTGLALLEIFDDYSTQIITSGFTCSPTTLTTAGTQTITVTYQGKTTTFNIYVTAVAVSGIAVKTNPTKTTYYVGDTLNTSGLTLTAMYNNGITQTVTSGFTCSPATLTTAGTQRIAVTYQGKTTTFILTVTAVTLSSIAVKTKPTKTSYFVGDTLDAAGLTLTANYNNGYAETVYVGYSCSPTALTTAGTKAITVTYNGKTTTFNVTVTAVTVSGITVKTNPTKTSYIVGDTLNTAGLTLTATYNNGTTHTVTSGFACSPTTLSTAGTKAITVTYNGKTTTFNVTVTATVKVTGIKLNAMTASVTLGGTKQVTATVSPSNATNKTVTWTSSNMSVATVSSSGLVTAKAVGKATITCKAKDGSGKIATCAVTVIPRIPTSVKAASASYNSIKITWSVVSGVTGYAVYRASSKTGTYSYLKGTTATSFTDISRATGTTYYYKVRAYKTIGDTKYYSGYSAIVYAKAVPAVPGSFTAAKASSTSVKTAWKAVSGASGYEVWMATSSTGTYSKIKTTSSLSFTKTNLTKNKTYYFKVRAYKTVNGAKVYGAFTSVKSAKPS